MQRRGFIRKMLVLGGGTALSPLVGPFQANAANPEVGTGIQMCTPSGGAPLLIDLNAPHDIIVRSDGTILFAEAGTCGVKSWNGNVVNIVISNGMEVRAMAAMPNNEFLVFDAAINAMRIIGANNVPVGSPIPTSLPSNESITRLETDGTNIYYATTRGNVWRKQIGATTAERILGSIGATDLALTDDNSRLYISATASGIIYAIPNPSTYGAGTPPAVFRSFGNDRPGAIAVGPGGTNGSVFAVLNISGLVEVDPTGTQQTVWDNQHPAESIVAPGGIVFGADIDTNRIYSYVNQALPVRLTNVYAQPDGDEIIVNWTTETEEQNAYFDVERSADGTNFEWIGRVDGHGTTQEQQDYEFVDEEPLPGDNYYRLKQVDYDGKARYSRTVVAKGPGIELTMHPNPVRSGSPSPVSFQIQGEPVEGGVVRIFNTVGQPVQRVALNNGQVNVDCLPSGAYTLKLENARAAGVPAASTQNLPAQILIIQ